MDSRLRKSDLWGVQSTSGEAVNSFSMTFAPLSLSGLGQRRARQQTQARPLEAGQAVPQIGKGQEAPLFFLAPASVGPAGRPGEERAAVGPADAGLGLGRPALRSPRAGSGKRRLPPITASTASCQVPALASKVAAQTPHTHWKVGPGPGPGPAPGIRRVSQGLGGGGGWEAISPPAPLRLRAATATAGQRSASLARHDGQSTEPSAPPTPDVRPRRVVRRSWRKEEGNS